MDGGKQKIDVAEPGKTLLALLQEQHIYIEALCGGRGDCGRCSVRFTKEIPEPTEKERRLLTGAELAEGIRLACAVVPDRDCEIELLWEKGEDVVVLATEHGAAAATEHGMEHGAAAVAEHGMEPGKAAATEGAEKDAAPASAGGESSGYGVAIDIGTTTLAAALVDLQSGEQRAVATSVNHQRAYGADVLSRIQAANEGKDALLRECICKDAEGLLTELTGQAGIEKNAVAKVVIAGNTTMCHLLRGLSCEGLGVAPFTPVDLTLWEGTVDELLGTSGWSAKAVIFPGISAFVGADIVAGIYSSGMDWQEKPCLLLDIGTNGEMVLGSREGFLVTSAAAGPVFEGGNISCGVPGIPGAVTHVSLRKQRFRGTEPGAESCPEGAEEPGAGNGPETSAESGAEEAVYESSYETIGGRPPVGLCGTGVIDVVSELVREGLVDENGTLAEPWFEEGFQVAGDEVRFTQRDIREIQMGKSAIRAGIETLLLEHRREETEQIYLAGGFGFYMDVEKAIRIGLFPASFSGRVQPIGNSALEGAKQFLLADEKKSKERLQWIVSHAREINLAMHPAFNDFYMQYMFFEEQI